MRHYWHLLFIIGILSATTGISPVAADSISVEAARRTATRLLGNINKEKNAPKSRMTDADTDLSLRERTKAVYVFSRTDGVFAAVAADNRLPAVLAYGSGGNKDIPDAMRDLFNYYDRLVAADNSAAVRIVAPYYGKAVPPMRTAIRHQSDPYNRHCPYYKNADGTLSAERCLVGCVATALETVLTYHRRTYTLQDTLKGWTTAHYDIPDIPAGSSVDARLIRHDYDTEAYSEAEADAVARLSYWLGVAVRMNWGLSSSGAHVSNVAEPLRRAFGLGYVHYADSYKYRPDDWLDMLRAELRAGRPVFYAGFGMRLNGHAFVLDGLDEEGFFHVNWGLGGDYDGYFRLDLLNPSEPLSDMTENGLLEGVFCNQEAVLIYPDELPAVVLPDTLERTGRELVVDSLAFMLPPEAGKYTPLKLFVRNGSEVPLTTPLGLFTNAPADTAFIEQSDFCAMTGVTLQPGEEKQLTVYIRFSQSGERLLRISSDDVYIIYERPVDILPGQPEELVFDETECTFPADGVAEIRQFVGNRAVGGRAGQRVTYELFEGEPREGHNGTCHVSYCFLPGGESRTDTVCFRNLQPGKEYTLYVRCPWTIRNTLRFTVPPATSIDSVSAGSSGNFTPTYYTIDGRRISPSARFRGCIVVGRDHKRYCHP